MTQQTSQSDTIAAKAPSMGKTFGIVAILTVASKFVGLIRDMVVASQYGTSVIADAYNYAYMFTGNILILFGGLGGPFHSSVVSILNPRKDDRDTGSLILQMLGFTAAVMAVVTLIAYLAAPFLVSWMTHLYNPDTSFQAHSAGGQATVQAINEILLEEHRNLFAQQMLQQLNIMLPLIVIAGVVGVSYGVLNVHHKIFWPSMSPAIASVAIIAAVLLSDPDKRLIYGVPLAVGTLAGAIGQMLAQMPDMAKLKLNWRIETKPQPGLREYLTMLWPAAVSTSVGQLSLYVDGGFAFLINQQGAWTAIVNSNRLVQLPLGILLTAILVPILPRFTQQAAENRHQDLKDELKRSLRFLWFVGLPVMAILLAVPGPLIEILFQRGNFDKNSSALVTMAFIYLVPSIFFYLARDLMTRVFYAFQDSKTPYKVALIAIFIKAPLDWALVTTMQSVAGISLATTLMTIINLSLLTWFLKRKIGNLGFGELAKPVVVMVAASILCGGLTWGIYLTLLNALQLDAALLKLAAICVSSAIGFASYVAFCVTCELDEPIMLARRVPVLRDRIPKDLSTKDNSTD